MAKDRVKIVVSPTEFKVIPPFDREVEAGYDPFKISCDWTLNTGMNAWDSVIVRNFSVTAEPTQLVFLHGDKTVQEVKFPEPVDEDTNCKYDVVYVKGSLEFTFDPTLTLKPGI